ANVPTCRPSLPRRQSGLCTLDAGNAQADGRGRGRASKRASLAAVPGSKAPLPRRTPKVCVSFCGVRSGSSALERPAKADRPEKTRLRGIELRTDMACPLFPLYVAPVTTLWKAFEATVARRREAPAVLWDDQT